MNPTSITLDFDRGTLLARGLTPDEGRDLGLKWDPRVSALRGYAISHIALREALARQAPSTSRRFIDNFPLPHRLAWPAVNLPKLRAEQSAALAAWRQTGRGMVIMPTGAGKTEVALAAMAECGIATLVVAPVRDLMHQWHHRIFRTLGYNAGIVGDSHFNIQPVTVTTYDSAYLHMDKMGDRFGLVIFDEAHHLPGQTYRQAAMMRAAPLRLGLTATPERSDGRHTELDALIGPEVYHQEISSARGRTLADYDIVRIPVRLEPPEQAAYDAASRAVQAFLIEKNDQLKQEGSESRYSWEDLCADAGKDPAARKAQKAYYHKQSIEDRAAEKLRVLEDLFRLHAGQRAIVFAGSNAMAIAVSRRFLVPTILAHTRKHERRESLEGFSAGRFPVLVANRVLDEGVDVPEAKVAIVIGGGGSTRQAKQRLGRILRKTGEARAVLYEVVCEATKEVQRSRTRRRSDAYRGVTTRRG